MELTQDEIELSKAKWPLGHAKLMARLAECDYRTAVKWLKDDEPVRPKVKARLDRAWKQMGEIGWSLHEKRGEVPLRIPVDVWNKYLATQGKKASK